MSHDYNDNLEVKITQPISGRESDVARETNYMNKTKFNLSKNNFEVNTDLKNTGFSDFKPKQNVEKMKI